ncbi:hypothetical protein FO519_007866 [Halicephalobus sp. NKZ332]|nr:hypothetical protein FO519_007866 [Halicephalobus sp. NKZ332]
MLRNFLIKLLLFLIFFDLTGSQCPYKHGKDPSGEPNPHVHHQHEANPPGTEPEESFIQTTFIHLDKNDADLKFTQDVIDLINILRQRLKTHAKLTIDNENIDCTDGGFTQCRDYPLKESYHFLIIEDSSHGAAVYSLDRKHNTNSGKTELALLDALSRHSSHPLMAYASEGTEKEVGFVREVTTRELAKFTRQNQAESKKHAASSIFTRSPTELDLLNEKILEFRDIEVPEITENDALKSLAGSELNDLLENEEKFIFVMFWTKVSPISLHALKLWKDAAEKLKEKDTVILGAVACHDNIDVCKAFAISHHEKNTIFAYKNAQKLTAQFNIRDSDFYVEWVQMVAAGILNKIDPSEVKKVRQGYLSFLSELGQRKAVTVGHFQSEGGEEFKGFQKVAAILQGRYHFVYTINKNSGATITTFRPLEKMKRLDYSGNFDIPSLVKHITQGSNPSIMDFGKGFTSDIVYYNPKDLVLLVHDEDKDRFSQFEEIASKAENNINFMFGQIDRSNSLNIDKFISVLGLDSKSIPFLCLFSQRQARCFPNLKEIKNEILSEEKQQDEAIVVEISSKKPHPLKFIQLEHINEIFGKQEIELLPDPILTKIPPHHGHGHYGSQNFEENPNPVAGGCPMMAHMNSHLRDEL